MSRADTIVSKIFSIAREHKIVEQAQADEEQLTILREERERNSASAIQINVEEPPENTPPLNEAPVDQNAVLQGDTLLDSMLPKQ